MVSIPLEANGWGKPTQGISNLLVPNYIRPSNDDNPPEVVKSVKQPIVAKGQHAVAKIREVAYDLVASVMKESRYKEVTILPGKPELHAPYVSASDSELKNFLREWCDIVIPESPEFKNKVRQVFGKPSTRLPLRVFMAYFQPLKEQGQHYNMARLRFLTEWMDLMSTKRKQQKMIKDGGSRNEENLFSFLSRLFTQWEACVCRIEDKGELGREEKLLADGIRQRRKLLKLAKTDEVLEAKEVAGWEKVWRTTTTDTGSNEK